MILHVRRILKVPQHQRRINIKACAVCLSRQSQGRREQSKGWKSSSEHIKDDIALIMSYEPKTTLLVMVQQPLLMLQETPAQPRRPSQQGNMYIPTKRWGWTSLECGHPCPNTTLYPATPQSHKTLSHSALFSSGAKMSTHLLPACAPLVPAAQTKHFE